MSENNSLEKTVGDITNIEEIAKTDQYLKIVNNQPPKDHIYDHPIAHGVKFIPIGVIETMLTKLFRHWNVEILREGQLLNSVYVTVRLNYLHPITKEWEHQDGVGAAAIQVDKGKDASDLGAIKSNAITLALPAAKSFAIKDAAEHIGRAFGRDLNRKDTLVYTSTNSTEEPDYHDYNRFVKVGQLKELFEAAKEASGQTEDEAINLWFREAIGKEMIHVRQTEFDNVLRAVKEEAV